ncbi:MAG: hypothetical protein ACK5VI_09175 [Opitutia bacterium]|jgi:hypothetical protein
MPGQGDFPLRSSWLGRGRGRGANPRKVVNVAARNSANAPVWINWTFNASGPFSQTLTANLFTNTQTFYAATVTRGTVNVSPALFTNSQTFYGPTVAQVTQLAPSLLTNTQTFYGPAVTSVRNLTPALFTNTQTFYSPTRTSSNAVAPSLLTNTQTFYSPTATRSNTVAPALYTNTQTFFAPAVTTTRTVEASLFTNSQIFYGPTATAINPLLPSLFTNDQTFYSPTVAIVGAPQFIEPSLFVNTNILYPPTVVDPPAQLVGGGGGEDSSRSRPAKTKRRKTGFANERAILEAALSDRVAKSADVLSDSNLAVAKKTAKTLNAYLNEKGTADALQSQLDRLLAQLSIKGANDQNNDSLNADLIAAADEIQQFLNDEQEAIQILLLDQENDDALLLMAMGF